MNTPSKSLITSPESTQPSASKIGHGTRLATRLVLGASLLMPATTTGCKVMMDICQIDRNQRFLNEADDCVTKEKYAVMASVQRDGLELKYADDKLKKDKDVVIVAVQQNGLALEYADESLKKNKEVVMEAVMVDGLST